MGAHVVTCEHVGTIWSLMLLKFPRGGQGGPEQVIKCNDHRLSCGSMDAHNKGLLSKR